MQLRLWQELRRADETLDRYVIRAGRALRELNRRESMPYPREVYRCSNPQCSTVWDENPRGHCPACIKPDGGGWSCITYPVHSTAHFDPSKGLPNQPRSEPHRDVWMDGYWTAVNENCPGDTSDEKHRWWKDAYERHQRSPNGGTERPK
jgi:hypothetical protein